MGLLTSEHLAAIGSSEPAVTVEVSRRDIVKYATATEQQQARYLSGDEAPTMFVFNLFSEIPTVDRLRPDGLARRATAVPSLPLKRVMAGGTELTLTIDAKAHQLMAKFMNPLVMPAIQSAIASDLDLVKAYCETAGDDEPASSS